MKAAPRFELGVRVLQTPALPLGYAAVYLSIFNLNTHYEILKGDRDSYSLTTHFGRMNQKLIYNRLEADQKFKKTGKIKHFSHECPLIGLCD